MSTVLRKSIKVASLGLALVILVAVGVPAILTSHDDVFSDDKLLVADASDLPRTTVTPHLGTPIIEGTNVLWCGSFQLAWNEACVLVGEDLHFRDEPAMVKILNKKSFTKKDIADNSYVALAGFVKDGIHARIETELIHKFHGQARPRLIPSPALTPRPQDIVAYAYLFKNLEFSIPFERIAAPLRFAGRETPCFGIGKQPKRGHAAMRKQLDILDYQNANDFIIALKTKSEQDQLILAKTEPAATLAETIKGVRERVRNAAPIVPLPGDVLKIPKLNFDITREYGELIRKKLLVHNPAIAPDLIVVSALQNTRFQFDEKGVRLRSEAHIAFGCSRRAEPPPPEHMMVFDKPFLIMLQQRGAKAPYFALWVANADLLVKVEPSLD